MSVGWAESPEYRWWWLLAAAALPSNAQEHPAQQRKSLSEAIGFNVSLYPPPPLESFPYPHTLWTLLCTHHVER